MESLIIYGIKVNVIISVFFTAYLLLFKNEKRFKMNRIFFIAALLISFVLPELPRISNPVVSKFGYNLPFSNTFNNATADYKTPANLQVPMVSHSTSYLKPVEGLFSAFNIEPACMVIYLLVMIVLLMRFFTQLLNVYLLIKAKGYYKKEDINICNHGLNLTPFSFFKYLVINPSGYSQKELQQIIAHEKVHIGEWHSIDVLLAEIVHIILWINPLMRLLKRAIKLNLEYIADEKVLEEGFDKKEYQVSILKNTLKLARYPLTNLYNSSKIKLRIKMINKNQTPAKSLYKYVFVLPLILGSYFLVNIAAARQPATLTHSKVWLKTEQLKDFDGYYRLATNKGTVFQVIDSSDGLIAKNLWNGYEMKLKQSGDLEFKSEDIDHPFTVDFKKDQSGEIIEAQVVKGGLWIKDKYYKPEVIDQVKLPQRLLKSFEGFYRFEPKPKIYLHITATENGLILESLWDGKETTFFPTSAVDFNSKQNWEPFPLKFLKDSNGKVVGMLAYERDKWDKVEK